MGVCITYSSSGHSGMAHVQAGEACSCQSPRHIPMQLLYLLCSNSTCGQVCILLHLYVYVSRPVKLQLLRQMSVAENSCTICADNVADTALVPCQHRYAPPTALSFTSVVLLSAEVMLPFLSVKNPAAAVHECCCFCDLGNIRKL